MPSTKNFTSEQRHRWDVTYRWRMKMDILRHYSGREIPECAWCSESDIRTLNLDHINGGGNKQRKSLGGNDHLFNYLRRQGYPEGYQVLCRNCNARKEWEEYNYYIEEVRPEVIPPEAGGR